MSRRQHILSLIVAVATATATSGKLFADDTNAALVGTVDQKIDQLDQEIRILKRQRELDQEQAQQAAQKAKKTPILQADDKGFGFKSTDGNFQLKLRGYVQADARFYLDDDAKTASDTFLLRRVRPILEGTLFKDFGFRIMPDFGGGTTVLQDTYLEWKHWSWLQVRAGKFKEPVGLERLQSGTDILFVERAFPTSLVPNRDVGLQLSGDVADGVVSYAVGVFNGVVDGGSSDGDNGDDKDLAARLFVQPFKKTDIEPLQGLGLGVAGTIGVQRGATNATNLASYKTAGQQTFFSYRSGTGGTFANGRRSRIVPQVYYAWGRLGLLGEYVISEQDVQRAATKATLQNTAWQVAGSFLLTDDQASFKGVNPKKPFDLKNGGWGAWELVARYSVLDVDNDTFSGGAASFANPATSASRASAWSVGLNWYLNKNFRAYLDYEQTWFDGGAAGGADRPDEKVLFTRLQVSF